MGFSSAFGSAGHEVARGPRARRVAVAVVALAVLSGCQGGEAAPEAGGPSEPTVPAADSGSISPATLEALKAISVEQAEINGRETVEQLSARLNPYKTTVMKELIENGGYDIGEFQYGDPLAIEAKIVVDAYSTGDYAEAQRLADIKGWTPELILEANRFYTAQQVEAMTKLAEYRESGDAWKQDFFEIATAGQVVSAIMADAYVTGRVQSFSDSEIPKDTRLLEFLQENLSRDIFTEVFSSVDFETLPVLIIDENGKIDTETKLDLNKTSLTIMPATTRSALLRWKSNGISGPVIFNNAGDVDYEAYEVITERIN